jgi:hypothetical protein
MQFWMSYPAFIGTTISIIGLSRLVFKEYVSELPGTLSELAAAEQSLLRHFRNTLLICDILFAITVFGFIAPRSSYPLLVVSFGILMIGGELLASLLPARDKTMVAHLVTAHIMALGMLGLVFTFWAGLDGFYSSLEMLLAFVMCAAALLTISDKKHYLAYELTFIFASHFSVVVAAIALS